MCDSVKDIYVMDDIYNNYNTDTKNPPSIGPYIAYSHPGVPIAPFEILYVTTEVQQGSVKGIFGDPGDNSIPDCEVEYFLDQPTWITRTTPEKHNDFAVFEMACDAANIMQPTTEVQIDVDTTSKQLTFDVDCLSFCSTEAISNPTPIGDMFVVLGEAKTFTFGSWTGNADPDCTLLIHPLVCTASPAGATLPPYLTHSSDPETIDWLVSSAADLGVYNFEQKVTYENYDGVDTTMDIVSTFTVTIISCNDDPIVVNNDLLTAIEFDLWVLETNTLTIQMPTADASATYPSACALVIEDTSANPDLVITQDSPSAGSVTLSMAKPDTSLVASAPLEDYYAAQPTLSLVTDATINFNVKHCTENAIQVSAPTSAFLRYNHEQIPIDLTPHFWSTGTGDYATSARCPIVYEFETSVYTPPNYVTIPNRNSPSISVTPQPTDTTFGTFTFTVHAFYDNGYETLDPSHIKSATFQITLTTACTEVGLTWNTAFQTSYTTPVGTPLTVMYNQVLNGRHLLHPSTCALDFYSSGTALDNLPVPVVTNEWVDNGGYSYKFKIDSLLYEQMGTYQLSVVMGYKYYPTHTNLQDTRTFTITLTAPDTCNTGYPRMATVYPATWTLDLCTTHLMTQSLYTKTAPGFCGDLNYYFSTSDPSVYSYSNDLTQQTVTVLASDRAYLSGGPYWVEIYPDYINDTDEDRTNAAAYHNKDYIETTFVSICENYQISQDNGAANSYEVDILENTYFTIPAFSVDAETICPSDCVQTFEFIITPNSADDKNGPITLGYNRSIDQLSILADDELQLGTWDVTLRIYYENYSLTTNKDFEYDFVVDVKSICLKEPVVQTAVPDQLEFFLEVKMDYTSTFSILDFWTNQGIQFTPEDCEVGLRIFPPSSLITVDPTSGGFIFTDQWADVKIHEHSIEIYFVNYDPSVTRNSIPIKVVITPNCAKPIAIDNGVAGIDLSKFVRPTTITNHIAAEGFYDLSAESESLFHAPNECFLKFWATATVNPGLILPQIDFQEHEIDDSGILHIISMLPMYKEAIYNPYQFRIHIEYVDYPGYDPLLGAEALVSVTIKPECTGITDFVPVTVTPQTHLYVIDNTKLDIPYEFTVQSDIFCEIQQIYNYKVNNDDTLVVPSLFLEIEPDQNLVVQSNDLGEKDKVYSVLIKATLQTIPKMTSVWIEFIVVMLETWDPCIEGTFMPSTQLTDYKFVITNNPADFTTEELFEHQFTAFDQVGNPYACPAIVYNWDVSNDISCPGCTVLDLYTTDPTKMLFVTQTMDSTFIGFHTVTIILSLDNYPFNQLIQIEKSFQLEISSACETAIISVPTRPLEIYYLDGTNTVMDLQTILHAVELVDASIVLDFCGNYEAQIISLQKQGGGTTAMARVTAEGTDLVCCSTDQLNDYGMYNIFFKVKFSEYGSHHWTNLQIELEIIPDCAQSIISLKPDFSEPLDMLGYIGQTRHLDLSSTFTHSFDGHYSDYCGPIALELEPTSTASTTYLSMSPTKTLTSQPTDVAQMNVPGETVQLQAYLSSFPTTTMGYFDLDTKVYPWCELTNYESTDNNPTYAYEVFVSADPFIIDMSFDMVLFTAESTPVCDTLRQDEHHFKFDHLLIDQRPSFFTDLGGYQSKVYTLSQTDMGTYLIRVTQSSELPNLITVQNWVDIEITLIIQYDPCYISYMLDQPEVSLDYVYEIDPLTKDAPVEFDVPLYYDHATLNLIGINCMPVTYEVGTVAEWAIIDAAPGIDTLTFTELTLKMAVWVKDHTLHGQTYSLTMSVKLQDYFVTVPPLVKTITVTVFSKCSQTYLQQDTIDADYRTWYATPPNLYFTYFVGDPIRDFQVQLKDSISWHLANEDGYLEDLPFCGMRNFELEFSLNDEYGPLVLSLESAQDYEPILNLFVLDLDVVPPKTLDVYGVYGNTMIDPDNATLYKEVFATLKVSISFFPDIKTEIKVNALILNSCDRVFLYHEISSASSKINYGVGSSAKSVAIEKYTSYLDYMLTYDFGYFLIPHDPICGNPIVNVNCLQEGTTTSDTIFQATDLTPFTEDFLLGLLSFSNAQLYYIEQPAFLSVKFNTGDGATHLTIQSDDDIWGTKPYVCVINAYFNASWSIARANDFALITILGVDYKSLNNAPEIRGLESTFKGEVGKKMQGTFTIIDPDIYDVGNLVITFSLIGDVEEDCGCVSFEGEYATLSGGAANDNLESALKKNQILTKISAEWVATPTKAMAGKTYEVMLTVRDSFAQAQSKLIIETEALPEEEIVEIEFTFEGVTETEEDFVEEDDGFIPEDQWLILYQKRVLGSGVKLTQSQIAEYLALLKKTNVSIPIITDINSDGVATVVFGQNLQQVVEEQLAAHIRVIQYNYAFDLTLEAEGVTIRGEPQIAKKFLPQQPLAQLPSDRILQASNITSLYATDYELTTSYFNSKLDRVVGSTAGDENEEFVLETRSFNWTITSLTETEMKIKLEFKKPEFISSYGTDSLQMHIQRPEIFLIHQGAVTQSKIVSVRNVPKQTASSAQAEAEAASAAGSVGLQVLTLVNVGIAGMMQMSLSELWIVINSLSFIVYLPLFTFIFPDNCLMVLEAFLSVVTFDIIETLDNFGLNVIPFSFAETPPYNENFEALGYENSNTFSLLGSVNIIILIMFMSFVFALLVKAITPLQNTRFGLYVTRKFPFKGQLDNLNRLIISGSMELLVCTIVMIVPSQTDAEILLAQDWKELDGIDQFSLVYGISIFAIFCMMVCFYLAVIIYLSPKVSFIKQQKMTEEIFSTKISAYSRALKDQQRKVMEEQEIEKQQRKERMQLQRDLFNDDDIPMSMKMFGNQDISGQEGQISIVDSIKSNDNFVIPFDNTVMDKELHVNKYAAMAAGFAIELGNRSDNEESEKENEDMDSDEELENHRKKSFAQYLYKKAIVQSDHELVNRISELKARRRKNHMLGLAKRKLTPFQEAVRHYFSDIFDGIDERYLLNYYYLLVYLVRRIAFVMTALYMTEYPHFQIILTYILCLLMLILLAGVRPYKQPVQNTLELINELVVLFLLMMTWMMKLGITSTIDPEIGIKVYEDFGLVFVIVLVACIVINLFRIMGQMAYKAQKSWRIKFAKALVKASINDRDMNFLPGSKQCGCKCPSCSPNGVKRAYRNLKENWGPTQPRFFQIHLQECPFDETASWALFVDKKREALEKDQNDGLEGLPNQQDKDQPGNMITDDAFLNVQIWLRRETNAAQVLPERQENHQESKDRDLLMSKTVNAKKVRFDIPEKTIEKRAPTIQKMVRFATDEEEKIVVRTTTTDEKKPITGTQPQPPQEEAEAVVEPVKEQEAFIFMQHLFETDGEEAPQDDIDGEITGGLLPTNTRQVRYRNWAKSGVFNPREMGRTTQARLRETIKEESKKLDGIEDVQELRKAANDFQFGEAIAETIEFKLEQKRHKGVWDHQNMRF